MGQEIRGPSAEKQQAKGGDSVNFASVHLVFFVDWFTDKFRANRPAVLHNRLRKVQSMPYYLTERRRKSEAGLDLSRSEGLTLPMVGVHLQRPGDPYLSTAVV